MTSFAELSQEWRPIRDKVEAFIEERVYPVEATRKLVLRRYRGASAGWVKPPHPLKTSTRRPPP